MSSGYGLNSDNTCEECAANCGDCLADVTECTTCDTGYIQNDDDVCQSKYTFVIRIIINIILTGMMHLKVRLVDYEIA